jgi:hypothetical protein
MTPIQLAFLFYERSVGLSEMANMKTKKEIEAWVLNVAREACPLIPAGQDTQREEPDFLITNENGSIGLEVTELLRPAKDGERRPVAEESRHNQVVQKAEQLYRSMANAKPIKVSVGFNYGIEYDQKEMALALATFVLSRCHLASPGVIFYDDLPALFFFIRLSSIDPDTAWWGGEAGGYTVTDIYEELALRIAAKNNKLPSYRTNLPGIPIWLLIYTGVAVSRSMSIPYGLEQWKQPFGFDRVIFFACLDRTFSEILPA